MSLLALLVAVSFGAEEQAPVTEGQRWSVVGPRTVGTGANAIEAGAGFPGLSVSYLRGITPTFDLGARVAFTYGLEGLITRVLPGAKLQGLVKWRLVDVNALSVGLTFEPGPLFAVDRFGNGVVGFALPLGVRLGVAVSSAITLGFSFDVPLWIQFGPFAGLNVPFLPGLGLEYFIKSELVAFFRARMGPTIRPFGLLELTLDAALGVGYRF